MAAVNGFRRKLLWLVIPIVAECIVLALVIRERNYDDIVKSRFASVSCYVLAMDNALEFGGVSVPANRATEVKWSSRTRIQLHFDFSNFLEIPGPNGSTPNWVLGNQFGFRVRIPLPPLAITFACELGLGIVLMRRRTKPDETIACSECGYDLRATPRRCPECGTEPASERVATAAS